MSLREQFEKLFPVPRGVEFCDGGYSYEQDLDGTMTPVHQFRWQGFQAGHAAGLEAAAKVCDENAGMSSVIDFGGSYALGTVAKAIRAMKANK